MYINDITGPVTAVTARVTVLVTKANIIDTELISIMGVTVMGVTHTEI